MKKTTLILVSGLFVMTPVSAEQQPATGTTLPTAERTQNINANTQEAQPADSSTTTSSQTEQASQTDQATTATAETMQEQTGFSRGSVTRSTFTSSIDNREPVDTFEKFDDQDGQVYFFTELRDMAGQTAKHRWEYNGEVMAEVEFNVKGNRWRVWSSKKFQPGWAGEWKVSVVNGADEVIAENTLDLVKLEIPEATTMPAESQTTPVEQKPTPVSQPLVE